MPSPVLLRVALALDRLDGLVDSILQELEAVAHNDLGVPVALSLVIEFLPIIDAFAGRKLALRCRLRPEQSRIREGNHYFRRPFNASWADVGRRSGVMHYVGECRCRVSGARMVGQSDAGFRVSRRAARNS